MAKNCINLQDSLNWCLGQPEAAGIKQRVFFIDKAHIAQWPVIVQASDGRPTTAKYEGSFVLTADSAWKFIDIVSERSSLVSEAQGEAPSQTQLNKLTALHPRTGSMSSLSAAFLNNTDNVFLVQDMRGRWRVVGAERWLTKTTVAQDNGQGGSGSVGTTIAVEATDVSPSPFYTGVIATEDGIIDASTTDIANANNTLYMGYLPYVATPSMAIATLPNMSRVLKVAVNTSVEGVYAVHNTANGYFLWVAIPERCVQPTAFTSYGFTWPIQKVGTSNGYVLYRAIDPTKAGADSLCLEYKPL